MRIEYLDIQNFRAIEHLTIEADSDMIVIAGPNGCGKSCILDAIRLIKSVYGGYDNQEYGWWLGEFQIDANSPVSMMKILRDKTRHAIIEIAVSLHENEKQYLLNRADELGERAAVKLITPDMPYRDWRRRVQASGQQSQELVQIIEAYSRQIAEGLKQQLKSGSRFIGSLTIQSNGTTDLSPNIVLQSAWSIYEPKHVGIIDYHGPQRHFARENVGNINLNLKTHEQTQRQSTLYNYGNKYSNIKTQMANEYVLYALQEEGGSTESKEQRELLGDTLKELFDNFFPGKEFQGVFANENGELEFSVNIKGSGKHDINDLSSGEKEILFGYLRLRNNAQRNSIILLDEPELHLNPKLIEGLPQFYLEHVASALNNQIWTVTHSDMFLREAISSDGPNVYHMTEADPKHKDKNQLVEIHEWQEEQQATLQLIGDIAGYRPRGKTIIFEGEDSEFDRRMVAKLFPDFDRTMNFVSGGNKSSVRRMHEILAAQEGSERTVFSVVDKDDDQHNQPNQKNGMYSWNVYHIENYLLDQEAILNVLNRVLLDNPPFHSADQIEAALIEIAEEQIEPMVEDQIRKKAHRLIRKAIELKSQSSSGNGSAAKVSHSVSASADRISGLVENELSVPQLENLADSIRAALREAVKSPNDWKKEFRGRDILKSFVSKFASRIGYETIRDMVVNDLAEREIRPTGMVQVLTAISNAN